MRLTDPLQTSVNDPPQSAVCARYSRLAPAGPRPPRILHVEDNLTVSEAVKETLEAAGFAVETCADGAEAARRLAGGARFDLLIFDNELPGLSGLELITWARRLPLSRRLPIIMLSASDAEAEARRAGADAYLRKPEGIEQLAPTVARLLREDSL
ncbi:MAG TPA: response regulator [Pyrinomonadaceae bacterium]|nr:response regulator [Pyrinomonadaceae bacterium]